MTELRKATDAARDWKSRRGQISGSLVSQRAYDADAARILRRLLAALDAENSRQTVASDYPAPPAAVPDREAVARAMYEAAMIPRDSAWDSHNAVTRSRWLMVADAAIAVMQATKGAG